MRSGDDLLIQQDLQEVPDLDPDDEMAHVSSAEEDLLEMHVFAPKSRPFFPPDCLQIVREKKGNSSCVDCQGHDIMDDIMVEPMYSSVTHGTLLCRICANDHRLRDERAFGIKSFMDDHWSLSDVLSLLEGGNAKFREYCTVTHAYPNLESSVGDKKEFIDGLYSSLSVKAYRSLLRKAVAHCQTKRVSVRNRHFELHHRGGRRVNPEWDMDEDIIRRIPYADYVKDMPMMSIYDYYTKILNKEWPIAKSVHDAHVEQEKKAVDAQAIVQMDASTTGGDSATNDDALEVSKDDERQIYIVQLKDETRLNSVPETSALDNLPVQELRSIHRGVVRRSSLDHSIDSCSVGSSVGSIDLRSIPEGKSVASSDVESFSDLRSEISNLNGGIQKHKSFRGLDPCQDSLFAPNNMHNSASDLYGLEASSNIGDLERLIDERSIRPPEMNTLELSLEKLNQVIGDRPQRQQGKTLGFVGLPSKPLERSTRKPVLSNRIKSAAFHPDEAETQLRRSSSNTVPPMMNPIPQERREKQRLRINGKMRPPSCVADNKYMPSEQNVPAAQRVISAYKEQMKTIARTWSNSNDDVDRRQGWAGDRSMEVKNNNGGGIGRFSRSLRDFSKMDDSGKAYDMKRFSRSLRSFPTFETT